MHLKITNLDVVSRRMLQLNHVGGNSILNPTSVNLHSTIKKTKQNQNNRGKSQNYNIVKIRTFL